MHSSINAILLLTTILCVSVNGRFRVIRQWHYANYTWSDDNVYNNAVYTPENVLINGLRYWNGYYYVSVPRLKNGVPATLARIPSSGGPANPSLEPYPTWAWNRMGDCDAFQNVRNIEIDSVGRMYVIDDGRVDALNSQSKRLCPPKLVIYDISKNISLKMHRFDKNVVGYDSSLYDLVVDETDGTFVYITDSNPIDPGIIVYSMSDNRAWKLRGSKTMHADPTANQIHVGGHIWNVSINIAPIALTPPHFPERHVYYAPLSGRHIYALDVKILRNYPSANQDLDSLVIDIGRKSSQTSTMIIDDRGVLYYNLLEDNAIGRWDIHAQPFQTNQNIIGKDDHYIEWASAMCFDGRGNLTISINRLNRFIHQTNDLNHANFWFISSTVGGRSYLDTPTSRAGKQANTNPHPPLTDASPTITSISNHIIPFTICLILLVLTI